MRSVWLRNEVFAAPLTPHLDCSPLNTKLSGIKGRLKDDRTMFSLSTQNNEIIYNLFSDFAIIQLRDYARLAKW
jgi:hypothetical protein